jgi:hypothetical protein
MLDQQMEPAPQNRHRATSTARHGVTGWADSLSIALPLAPSRRADEFTLQVLTRCGNWRVTLVQLAHDGVHGQTKFPL